MCWGKEIGGFRQLVRVAVVLAFGALTAACFQPLYGTHAFGRRFGPRQARRRRGRRTSRPPMAGRKRGSRSRLRNALMYDFNGGAAAAAPTHRLQVTMSSGIKTVIVDVASGRPETQVEVLNATLP